MKRILLLSFIITSLFIISCKKVGHSPVITMLGKSQVETGYGLSYHDAGATATDEEDGDLTDKIVKTTNVDTSLTGTYYVKYNVTDSDGNKATEVSREVIVKYFK